MKDRLTVYLGRPDATGRQRLYVQEPGQVERELPPARWRNAGDAGRMAVMRIVLSDYLEGQLPPDIDDLIEPAAFILKGMPLQGFRLVGMQLDSWLEQLRREKITGVRLLM